MPEEPAVTPRPLNIENQEHSITIANESKGMAVLERLRRHPAGRDLEPIIRDLLYAIESAIRFQDQHFRAQLRADLRNLEWRIDNASSVTNVSISLVVIPDGAVRAESIELVESVERAIDVLHDLGLNETQTGIIRELIFPAITELKEILNATASDVADLDAKRSRGLSLVGRVMSLVQAVCSGIGVVGGIEKAIGDLSNAADVAEKALKALQESTHLERVWGLLLRLYQSR